MIEINLLPEERRKKQERLNNRIDLSKINLNLQNLPVLNIIGGVFAVLIVLQVVLFFIGMYAKTYLNSLEARYAKIMPERQEAGLLKSQVDTINKKMNAIDELMVKRFSWAKKLSDLSDSLTPGIWLTELSYNERLMERLMPTAKNIKGKIEVSSAKPIMERVPLRYLTIAGMAASMGEEGTASIGRFIKSLKDNSNFYSDFSEIELGAIKRDRFDDQEVMSFKITCFFKENK